jgi:tryptophan synthase beta chain
VLHGAFSYLLQDDDGQVALAHSIAAGLDYPGVGPEHSALKDAGRVVYDRASDDDALAAFQALSRTEGILPALEPSHALAFVRRRFAPRTREGDLVVVNLSGRGDKDIEAIGEGRK